MKLIDNERGYNVRTKTSVETKPWELFDFTVVVVEASISEDL